MLAPGEFRYLACGSQMLAMQPVLQIRHANLLRLLAQEGTIQAFADKVERSHSQISQLKNRSKHSKTGEPREVGDDMARHIETKLKLPEGWMDTPHDESTIPLSQGVAQDMSLARPILAVPKVAWEDLMRTPLNQPFELEVIDDALAPEIPRGCVARLDPQRQPRPGQPVLVRDSQGRHYLRDYQLGSGGRWQAVARARGFAPLDSVDDGLELIAAVKGIDWP